MLRTTRVKGLREAMRASDLGATGERFVPVGQQPLQDPTSGTLWIPHVHQIIPSAVCPGQNVLQANGGIRIGKEARTSVAVRDASDGFMLDGNVLPAKFKTGSITPQGSIVNVSVQIRRALLQLHRTDPADRFLSIQVESVIRVMVCRAAEETIPGPDRKFRPKPVRITASLITVPEGLAPTDQIALRPSSRRRPGNGTDQDACIAVLVRRAEIHAVSAPREEQPGGATSSEREAGQSPVQAVRDHHGQRGAQAGSVEYGHPGVLCANQYAASPPARDQIRLIRTIDAVRQHNLPTARHPQERCLQIHRRPERSHPACVPRWRNV